MLVDNDFLWFLSIDHDLILAGYGLEYSQLGDVGLYEPVVMYMQ